MDGEYAVDNKLAISIIQELKDIFSKEGLDLVDVHETVPALARDILIEIGERRIQQTFAVLEKPPIILRYRSEAESRRITRLKRWITLQ